MADEAFRVSPKSGVQNGLAMEQQIGGFAVMNHGGGHQAQAGMVVFQVIPAEESLAETACIFDRPEAVREAGAVFEGAELAFRVRIVVGNWSCCA